MKVLITNLDVKVGPPALKPQSVDNFYEAGQGGFREDPLSNKNVSFKNMPALFFFPRDNL